MDSTTNINLNDNFSTQIENQPFFPKLNFINLDKIELIERTKPIILIISMSIFILIFFIYFLLKFLFEKNQQNLICLMGFIIGIFFYVYFIYTFPKKRYIYFDRDEFQLKLIYEKFLCFKTKIKSYSLYEIESFTHILKKTDTYQAIFKFKYIDKKIEIMILEGNYPQIYKSLELFLNLKLQEITKKNYKNSETFY